MHRRKLKPHDYVYNQEQIMLTEPMLPKMLVDLIYPLGSIYRSRQNISPETFLGGIWQQVTDHELVAYAHMNSSTLVTAKKNITSVTSSSTGIYTVTLSKPMSSEYNYEVFVSAEVGGRGNEIIGIYNKTSTTFLFDITNWQGGAAAPSSVDIAVFGRLATPDIYTWERIH